MFYSSNLREFLSGTTFVLSLVFVVMLAVDVEPTSTVGGASDATAKRYGESPVLIIDPGHGGEDGGAVAADGTLESDINFQIALRLESLALFWGADAVKTRDEYGIDYPEAARTTRERKLFDQRSRVELINSYPNAVLISIHQNRFPDSRLRGAQVLYARTEGSAALGETAHGNLTARLCPESRRVAAPISEAIYITKMINCPAILVECGFLSNRAEAELLKDSDYQRKISLVLLSSYLQYLNQSALQYSSQSAIADSLSSLRT